MRSGMVRETKVGALVPEIFASLPIFSTLIDWKYCRCDISIGQKCSDKTLPAASLSHLFLFENYIF